MDRHLVLAHELDAAWIIALWLAIHGGDPAPIEISQTQAEAVSASIVAALSPAQGGYIGAASESLSLERLQSRLKEFNVKVTQGRQATGGEYATQAMESQGAISPELIIPLEYCFEFGGKTYCVTIQRRRPFKVQNE